MKKVHILLILLCFQFISYAQGSPEYEVYAIRFGKSGHINLSEVAIGGSTRDSVSDCFMFWLLRGNDKNIMIDAGFLLNENSNADKFWNSSNYIRPDSALWRMKIKAADITDIIITHPHWDHIGGIDLFPNAQLWMQMDDYSYFVGPAWQKNGNHGGFYQQDVKIIVAKNLEGKLNLIKGDGVEILPGIRAFIGSKHTWASQYLLVNTATDKVIIASDNSWYYYNIEHLVSIPSKFTFDSIAYKNQLKRMRILQPNTSLIIPGHDALVFSNFTKVAEDIVKIR